MAQYVVSITKVYEVEANTEHEATEIAKKLFFEETGTTGDEIECCQEED